MSNPARPVSLTPIDTAWGLAVADTVVRTYPNAATRDADLGGFASTELLGQAVVLTDTGALQVYAGPVAGWRPPWSMPWGVLPGGIVSSTLDVTSTATFQTILSSIPSVTLLAGRSYRALGMGTCAVSAPGQLLLQAAGTNYRGNLFPIGSGEETMTVLAPFAQGSTLTAQSINLGIVGNGGVVIAKGSLAPHRLIIEDVGPSANPTALVQTAPGMLEVDPDLLEPEWRATWDAQLDLEAAQLEADETESR